VSLPNGNGGGGGLGIGPTLSSGGGDGNFQFHDVYAYPNPARQGSVPTIHVEVGLADRVTIRISDVASREIHSVTLDQLPQRYDTGNGAGPQYAYDYQWSDQVPSGIYFYTIDAEKTGEHLRKSGRLVIVK
jgi:hypothetical protein